jgi:hypothetical protein
VPPLASHGRLACSESELAEWFGQRLGFGIFYGRLVEHDDAAVFRLRRQRMLERERANFLRQVNRMATHQRSKSTTTAPELRHARGAMACATGPLLRVHLLAGPPDFAAVFGLVGAALTFRQLPIHAALDDVGPRLESEDRI